MKILRDEEFTRCKVYQKSSSGDGEFTRLEVQEIRSLITRWGVYEMGSSGDGLLTKWGVYEIGSSGDGDFKR